MQQAEIDLAVMRARQGSEQAFGRLFEHFNPAVLRFAYRLGSDTELARDAVQEAWLEIARTMRRLHDPRGFRSWLFRLVRWRVLDHVRKSGKHGRNRVDLEPDEMPATQPSAEPTELIEQINQLPALEQQAIHLYYLEQLTIAEIAIVTEVPPGTVKSRLHRARKHLKQRLEQEQ